MKKLLKEKFISSCLRVISYGAALVFLLGQNDTCFIWLYQAKEPKKPNNFSIKNL